MKRILLTNDDGIHAPGLRALIDAFRKIPGTRVLVLAPDRQRSATGHSINLYTPVKLTKVATDEYAIDGAPADCVKIGLAYFREKIDLVVSGINHGPNLGVDVYYSGTVAAAREAVINGVPGIAVSLAEHGGNAGAELQRPRQDDADASAAGLDAAGHDGGPGQARPAGYRTAPEERAPVDFSSAAQVSVRVARHVLQNGLPPEVYLNVNVPGLPDQLLKGIRVTRQGKRVYSERLDERVSPFGQTYFWVACDQMGHTPSVNGDLDAVEDGFVSLTPLRLDATDDASFAELAKVRFS